MFCAFVSLTDGAAIHTSLDGARRYFDLDIRLIPVAGYGARFADFKPQRFIGLVFMYEHLNRFFKFVFTCM